MSVGLPVYIGFGSKPFQMRPEMRSCFSGKPTDAHPGRTTASFGVKPERTGGLIRTLGPSGARSCLGQTPIRNRTNSGSHFGQVPIPKPAGTIIGKTNQGMRAPTGRGRGNPEATMRAVTVCRAITAGRPDVPMVCPGKRKTDWAQPQKEEGGKMKPIWTGDPKTMPGAPCIYYGR